ncbi:MAG TPA: type 2 isopentenyl-diphosphate Delta-isomerase [Thermomicrobiales bacterium]|nr:type 2 isopentenyl-diphosphate Delta-isomerase [Thermomicrobiales bacterium]
MTPRTAIEERKLDHIDINLRRNVEPSGLKTGFERLQFKSNALPELSLDRVDTTVEFLGTRLAAPVLISSMTGGVERGWEITRRLAGAAQALGCAIGVGSQRAALEHWERAAFFEVRSIAPDALLFANIGAVQLNYGYTVDECRRAVEMIGADGLFLHLNPLQEALQADGDTDFTDLARKIEAICRQLDVPVIVKEVGFGISATAAIRLANCGVSAIDVSGSGGTSWSAVEHLRCADEQRRQISRAFLGWGIPTARCLIDVRRSLPDMTLLASGGMRTGVDVAKALALGANLAGIAGPLLRAAAIGEEAAHTALQSIITELRIAMFAVGAPNTAALGRDLLFELDAPILGFAEKSLP